MRALRWLTQDHDYRVAGWVAVAFVAWCVSSTVDAAIAVVRGIASAL